MTSPVRPWPSHAGTPLTTDQKLGGMTPSDIRGEPRLKLSSLWRIRKL